MSAALYIQIADHLSDKILRREIQVDTRLDTPHAWASKVGLNKKAVEKAYDLLLQQGVLIKNDEGYVLHAESLRAVSQYRRHTVVTDSLPAFFSLLNTIDIDPEALKTLYENYLRNKQP